MAFTDLLTHFHNHFDIVLASNPRLRHEVYGMRYKVYCEELEYENPDNFPDKLEIDSFDDSSIHCLLKHKETGLWAGCVRLVLPNHNSNSLKFPCEKLFGSLSRINSKATWQDLSVNPIGSIGEVSRLAVPANFRRRQSDRRSAYGTTDSTQSFLGAQKRQFPIIPMSLYLAASTIAIEQGLDYVVTVMEARLVRHLRYFGIRFTQIGDLIEFNGKRGLFLISRRDLFDNIRPECYELMTFIQSRLEPSSSAISNQSLQPLVMS